MVMGCRGNLVVITTGVPQIAADLVQCICVEPDQSISARIPFCGNEQPLTDLMASGSQIYSLRPVAAIPWMNARCRKKNNRIIGSVPSTAMAISWSHEVP
jgi:hypothetical protein